MATAAHEDLLAQERRRRLAAERLLAQKSDELFSANRLLASHADKLSDTVIEQREENEELLGENQELQGEKARVLADLGVATEQAGKAERRLWDSLEAIGDGFAVFDRNWCLVAANRHYMSFFNEISDIGLGTPYDLIVQTLVDEGFVDIGDADPEDWIDDMLARWEQRPVEDIVLRLFNGQSIRVQDKESSDGGIVSMVTNITENLEREAEMRAARDAAETASRAKSAFLAKMSHEIRTPMNGVVGMADLILEAELDDENRLYAETIRSSAEALLVIINDILDYSKLEAEKMEFRPVPTDLEKLLCDVIRLSYANIGDKPVQPRLNYPTLGRTGFILDEGKMRQVLNNLVGNAVKFTEEGHVTISVEISAPNGEGIPTVAISVEDTGIGIPPDLHTHIFGEFNQVEDEKNRKFEGTGLGLAITQGIIERMGGTLELTSTLGEGSCFTLRVPLEPDPSVTPIEPLQDCKIIAGIIGFSENRTTAMIDRVSALGVRTSPVDLDTLATAPADVIFVSADDQCETINSFLERLPKDVFVVTVEHTSHIPELLSTRTNAHLPPPFTGRQLKAVLEGIVSLNREAMRAEIGAQPNSAPAEKLRILAAEDNKTNQFVFKKMLKTLNIDLTMVENGREAVDAFLEVRPHLIMTDISMPEMDGMDATRAIRAIETENGQDPVPIIAMTAHAMEDDEANIKAAGLDHYLTKPLKKALLIETILAFAPDGFDILPDEATA